MIDNPLTLGPNLSSKLVGRAQGFYALPSQEEVGLLMSMNFAFTEGKYNGGTITVLGRNPIFNKVREMPVIEGSGLFRFARGYVHARTNTLNLTTGMPLLNTLVMCCVIEYFDSFALLYYKVKFALIILSCPTFNFFLSGYVGLVYFLHFNN